MKSIRVFSAMILTLLFSVSLNAQNARQTQGNAVTAESFAKTSSTYMKSTFHLSEYQANVVEQILVKYPGNYLADPADFSHSHSTDAQREIIEVLTPEQGEQYKLAMVAYDAKQHPVQPAQNSKTAPKSGKTGKGTDKK